MGVEESVLILHRLHMLLMSSNAFFFHFILNDTVITGILQKILLKDTSIITFEI